MELINLAERHGNKRSSDFHQKKLWYKSRINIIINQ